MDSRHLGGANWDSRHLGGSRIRFHMHIRFQYLDKRGAPSPARELVELFFAENGIKAANALVRVVPVHARV